MDFQITRAEYAELDKLTDEAWIGGTLDCDETLTLRYEYERLSVVKGEPSPRFLFELDELRDDAMREQVRALLKKWRER